MVKLILIGIDGATWRVMDPLIDRGELPNIARLRRHGASGTLRAFSHLLTSAALWTTIHSGKTEQKHGIQFFGSTARDVRVKRIWEILGEHGWRVGVCGELMTWPPSDVNGFLIPDLFALGPETYPANLQFLQELALGEKNGQSRPPGKTRSQLRNLVSYRVRPGTLLAGVRFVAHRRLHRKEPYLAWFWRKALLQPRIYTDVVMELSRRSRLDYLSFHFHTTDTLSHRYWKYWDPAAFPDVDPVEVGQYRDVMPAAYREADRTVGQLLRLADRDTTIAIVSDHGFAPIPLGNYKFTLRLERVMALLGLADGAAVPARLGATHVLYLRDATRQAEVENALREVRIERTGEPLFLVRQGEGFVSFLIADRKHALQDEVFIASFGRFGFGDLFEDRGFVDSGEHHPDGVIILHGPGIQPGFQLSEPSILDVAPTLLALAGLPVAHDMDGRPLTEAFTNDFLQRNPISYCDSFETGASTNQSSEHDAAESAVVLERLRALGYL